jgi:hypothetical protein
MSYRLRHLTLMIGLALGLGTAPGRAAAAEILPDRATTICAQHPEAIAQALKAYRRAHYDALPAHLSDLWLHPSRVRAVSLPRYRLSGPKGRGG